MDFPDSFDRAEALAEAAFSMMRRQGIAPTPKNYTILYAYCSKSDPDLVRIIDAMIEAGGAFTRERTAEIFSQFFELDIEAEAIRQTGAMIEASVTKVLERLGEARNDAAHYGERLKDYSGRLADGVEEADLRGIVDNILSETHKMRERSEKITNEIKHSSLEIVELKRDLENVRREANIDGLTGIANRRSFDKSLHDAIIGAGESGEPLSLLMIDIDHFKRFNDTYGHQIGDKVLQLVARILKSSVKGRDTVARYGGEEFAIVLPQTALSGAATVAEQIRATVATRKIVEKGSGEDFGTITLSIGVAELRRGEAPEDVTSRADEALYAAKHTGRNRVTTENATAFLVVS